MPNASLSSRPCYHCGKQGALLQCSRCRKVAYCGYTCQRKSWGRHKALCSKVAEFTQARQAQVPDSSTASLEISSNVVPSSLSAPVGTFTSESTCTVQDGQKSYYPIDPIRYHLDEAFALVTNIKRPVAQAPSTPVAITAKPPEPSKLLFHTTHELDRIVQEIQNCNGSILRPRITPSVERDLLHCRDTLDCMLLTELPRHPQVSFLQGCVHFFFEECIQIA